MTFIGASVYPVCAWRHLDLKRSLRCRFVVDLQSCVVQVEPIGEHALELSAKRVAVAARAHHDVRR